MRRGGENGLMIIGVIKVLIGKEDGAGNP